MDSFASTPMRPSPTFGLTNRVPIPSRTKLREQSSLSDSTNGTSVAKRPRPRSRSGRSFFTVRDAEVLTCISHQYGANYAHLAVMLSRKDDGSPLSDSGVRQWVARMERSGLVTKLDRLRSVWVTPTSAGYERVGLTYSPWQAPVSRIAHCDAVNRMRLWWESDSDRVRSQGKWISERALLAERGRDRDWHISDAELRRPGATSSMAVEVELHHKTPRSRYRLEVIERLRSDVSAVLYVCPPDMLNRLTKTVEWAHRQSGRPETLRVFVRPLPHLKAQ